MLDQPRQHVLELCLLRSAEYLEGAALCLLRAGFDLAQDTLTGARQMQRVGAAIGAGARATKPFCSSRSTTPASVERSTPSVLQTPI